jgi:hypothetical protein
MQEQIKSQLTRAEELLGELRVAYSTSIKNKEASPFLTNITQEFLFKLDSILDQTMYAYFKQNISPKLSPSDPAQKNVAFPMTETRHQFESQLGKMKITKKLDSRVYSFLESYQFFKHASNKWLINLKKYADERHVRLTPQKKVENARLRVKRGCGGGDIIFQNVIIENGAVSIDGKKIHNARISTPKNTHVMVDRGLNATLETWDGFYFEGSDIEILGFCEGCLQNTKDIAEKFSRLF